MTLKVCPECEGAGYKCAHPQRYMFVDECPEGFDFNCVDCELTKVCTKCKGVGMVDD